MLDGAMRLVRLNDDDSPLLDEVMTPDGERPAAIEIPSDIVSLQQRDFEMAVAWRDATRRAFTEAISAGYLVEEFFRINRNNQLLGAYLLSRRCLPKP